MARESSAQRAEPVINRIDAWQCQPAGPPRAIDSALDQLRTFEHLEMARNRRLRDVERPRELHDGRLALRQATQNRAPCGIGERRENMVEGLHTVSI